MSYDYLKLRHEIFTEAGTKRLIGVRNSVFNLLQKSGAVRAQEVFNGQGTGSTWDWLACLDYLVELKEIREVTPFDSCWAQHRVFVAVDKNA